uniref:HEAT repeat domain-containing protein n=1 Tax=candidate division WOR-3 bacterium TaxID=2052148 RepID=A0A7C2K2T5_UNCW3
MERYGGFHVVERDSKTYDATLLIKARGTPLGAYYIGDISGYHYSGAEIKGESLLLVKDKTFKWTFSHRREPAGTIYWRYPTPNDALFKEVFNEVFYSHIMKVLSALRGIEPLISALKDVNWHVREAVAYALGEIKDLRAVEPLISALKDVNSSVRRAAAKALEEITGQNFGEDQAKWQEWWEKNKGRLQK